MIYQFIKKIKFDINADRIGPDIPFTHWKLYFKKTMLKLCEEKFSAFGRNSEMRPGSYAVCCSNISIGERVVIRPGSMLFAYPNEGHPNILIEDDVLIGSGVHIYTANHKFGLKGIPVIKQGYFDCKPVIIKRGSWIGANVMILPGVTIGENSVVGASSVVTKSVPDNVLVVGNPARIIKEMQTV